MGSRAIFIDRDGVICANRDDYVKSWDEFIFIPGAADAIKQFNALDFRVVIVSNQSAIGRGLMSEDDLEQIHKNMSDQLAKSGATLDGIYYCPHRPEQGCLCRKPRTGMFEKASHRFGIEMPHSYLIGDAESDMRAGRKIRSTTVLVRTGRGGTVNLAETHYQPDHIADNLADAAALIARIERNGGGTE